MGEHGQEAPAARVHAAEVIDAIKRSFREVGNPAMIPLMRGSSFTARLSDEGLYVDNLGNNPFLPWSAFEEAVTVLIESGGRAPRGDAMKAKLGRPGLPMNSVEGHVADAVFGKRPGESVFRRITPIACILIWAGVCEPVPGGLSLRGFA
jgi:hypothetical protein